MINRRNKLIYAISLFLVVNVVSARAQTMAIKTNVLYWATTTPNVAFETKIAKKWTLDFSVGYNPFTLSKSDNKKLKHVAIQPEVRYWLCSPYAGHFVGGHLLYSHYNASGIDVPFGLFPELKDHRFQGDLGAVGVLYGYSWMLPGDRWSIEGVIGIGYGITHYSKYACEVCGSKVGTETKSLFMPTKLALSVVYYIK